MKKKILAALLISCSLLTACGGKEKTANESTVAAESQADKETLANEGADTEEKTQSVDSEQAIEESVDEQDMEGSEDSQGVDLEAFELKNDYFGARFKEYQETDEELTIIFEFVNITDETYWKGDEEIPSHGTWEKVILYPKTKWESLVGVNSWIHYDFNDAEQNTFFKGGLKFSVDENLQVSSMELFEE